MLSVSLMARAPRRLAGRLPRMYRCRYQENSGTGTDIWAAIG